MVVKLKQRATKVKPMKIMALWSFARREFRISKLQKLRLVIPQSYYVTIKLINSLNCFAIFFVLFSELDNNCH